MSAASALSAPESASRAPSRRRRVYLSTPPRELYLRAEVRQPHELIIIICLFEPPTPSADAR